MYLTETQLISFHSEASSLLQNLIKTPSFSGEEQHTADLIADFLLGKGIPCQRSGNNVWAFASDYDSAKPSILLNSHHDTVKPNSGYTKDPFLPVREDGKIYGLGSNDAGGCLVSLLATFCYFKNKDIPFNLCIAATAEEEISGKNGIESILPVLPEFDLAIVGEPTLMQMAVAEKGLLVIDCVVKGKAGHAAREEGENAIYKALLDLNIIRDYQFAKVSPLLGKTKVTATIIQAGTQHNVVPDTCTYTLDVRVTDSYTLQECLSELENVLHATLTPRSLRLNSSRLPSDHPVLKVATEMKLQTYGSPTLSDQALIPYPSVKIGPGDSARSHTADEFIFEKEIKEGIEGYIQLLNKYFDLFNNN
jgi:acetylornithine deacetylase